MLICYPYPKSFMNSNSFSFVSPQQSQKSIQITRKLVINQPLLFISVKLNSSLYNYHGIIIHAIFSDFYFLTYNVMYACANLYHTLWSNSSISRRIILLPMFDRLLAFCFYDISTKTSLEGCQLTPIEF